MCAYQVVSLPARRLKEPTRLGRAAEETSFLVVHDGRDLSVDVRGWRPAAGVIEGPALPGLAGAVQAQHNLLATLGRCPNVMNLRRLLHSQAGVSHKAAKHAATIAPDLFDIDDFLPADAGRAPRDRNRTQVSCFIDTTGGFTALWERKRVDLRAGALILREEYHELFDDELREAAEHRLGAYGYAVSGNDPEREQSTNRRLYP
jgi:hypothetical protein